jgi:hypothetical protein
MNIVDHRERDKGETLSACLFLWSALYNLCMSDLFLSHTPSHQMGIKGLTKLLGEHAPECMKEKEMKAVKRSFPFAHKKCTAERHSLWLDSQFFGRKIAIDASMSLYQFMIAVRYDGAHTLTDADGETTS